MDDVVNISLDNPVIKSGQLDDLDIRLLEAAQLADRGQDIPEELVKSDVPPIDQAKVGDEQQSEPAPERARDPITGKFIKTDAEIAAETGKQATEAPGTPNEASKSEYEAKKQEKQAKEQARLDKTWENVNRQKEEIEQRRLELEQREQRMRQPPPQPVQKREYTSQQLYDASEDFKAEAKKALDAGDYEAFQDFSRKQELALQNAIQFHELEDKERIQIQQQQYAAQWDHYMVETFKSDPELAKKDSELSNEINAVMASKIGNETVGNILYRIPQGFPLIHAHAQALLKAKAYDDAIEANKRLKAENDRLTGLTSVKGGGVTGPPAKKNFDDMTDAEQDAYLVRQAHLADNP